MSNNDQGPTCGQVVRAENLAAELTHAVYPLLLRRRLKDSWLKNGTDCLEAFDKNDHAMDRRAAASNDSA